MTLAVAAALLVGWISYLASGSDQAGAIGDIPTAKVQRGRFVVSVNESGSIESERQTLISNDMKWPAIIEWVVEEGSSVKVGEEIIRFECKELKDAIADQRLVVIAAQSEYQQIVEGLELKQREVDSLVRRAENSLDDSRKDLQRFTETDSAQMGSDAQRQIDLAEADLKLAQEKLNFKLKANEDPELNSPYSKNEVEADKLSVSRLNLSYERAVTDKEMLAKYDLPRLDRLKRVSVEDTQLQVTQQQLNAKTVMNSARANERERKRRLDMQTERLTELLDDEAKLVIKADRPGLIVYNVGDRGNGSTVVAKGEKINPRQQLMVIPDMSTLQVVTKVYEGVSEEVHAGDAPGQTATPAWIRMESRPDERHAGHVTKVAPVPDSRRWWDPSQKVFPVRVAFDNPPEGLKPSLSAQVEMILAELPDALYVPITSVFTEQEQTYCWQLHDNTPKKVFVQVGRTNETDVQILAGLKEGDTVLLVAPPGSEPTQGQGQGGIKGRGPTTSPASRPTSRPPALAPTSAPTTTTAPAAATQPTSTSEPTTVFSISRVRASDSPGSVCLERMGWCISQGVSLLSPGWGGHILAQGAAGGEADPPALGMRSLWKRAPLGAAQSCDDPVPIDVSPLAGLEDQRDCNPRACYAAPWAKICRPYRA